MIWWGWIASLFCRNMFRFVTGRKLNTAFSLRGQKRALEKVGVAAHGVEMQYYIDVKFIYHSLKVLKL